MFDALNTTDWGGRAPVFGAALLFGYLLGSIPFGLLFSWLAGAGDVRKIGSGNIGATNVLRTGKRWAALATLTCDGGKGALAVIFAGQLHGEIAAVIAGFGAFIGHVFPLWLRFRGGKGVATFFGVLLALAWPAGLLALATWLAVAAIFRISSLSALTAAALAPTYMMLFGTPLYAMLALLLAILIFATHRENLRRLFAGREPRIGAKT
ncbi:MAG TPA: glycerol-3-phosphate 1-O-acyltransferase PlsY [Rhizomicrobium sp.]|jgi:glycerol-3-phosphate acyltransferase PlsY|nr:glycerol-3-phosphate 1-O-acyltransferase PlsY [Rhizomicrobium sp.]